MFEFLKDKLKNWKDKIKEEFTEETPKEIKVKKLSEIKSKKSSKKDEKTNEKPSKSEKKKSEKMEENFSPKKLATKNKKQGRVASDSEHKWENGEKFSSEENEEIQTEQPKQGFFSKLFSHKTEEQKTSEKIIEDIKEEGTEIKSPEERTEELEKEHAGFFDKFKKKVTEEKFEELFQELEMTMLQNNVAYGAVQEIKKNLSSELIGKNLSEVSIEEKLKEAISGILMNPPNLIKQIKDNLKTKSPYVIVFVGINGSGKTTSIAKVAHLLKKEKLSVCIGAADTFRAAAIEQLETHANKIGVPLIKKDYGSDPAAVGFEAIAYAKKHKIDVVLIDTAGRMNTKESLMKEMEKIIRVCNPDLKIFLGESITGNDATEQASSFNQHISIDGIILSKADVDEKGGTALSVSFVTKKPIYFLGTGQSYDDLEVFDKDKIIKSLGL